MWALAPKNELRGGKWDGTGGTSAMMPKDFLTVADMEGRSRLAM
jgi:hypothetical protein